MRQLQELEPSLRNNTSAPAAKEVDLPLASDPSSISAPINFQIPRYSNKPKTPENGARRKNFFTLNAAVNDGSETGAAPSDLIEIKVDDGATSTGTGTNVISGQTIMRIGEGLLFATTDGGAGAGAVGGGISFLNSKGNKESCSKLEK